ncbi:MAG TPA: glycosyltransferase family 2 protein [Desulfomonilaceae bacterium]|nr:glycosyltransferase family 2 protein [Desulfomonilaceae bacterium]
MEKPTVICLTPVKNEAWILDRFLKCASLWADHIIVADQNSSDGSVKIAQRFQKVRLIQNDVNKFNEPERVQMLLAESRKIPGLRLLISLDADEFLTSNFVKSAEWQTMLNCEVGTLISFDRVNIFPGMSHYWFEGRVFGFMDDGSPYQGPAIHSPRVPLPIDAPTLALKEIKVMHYQYTDWDRMWSKQRWYQCYELVHGPTRSPAKLYRKYHHMYSVRPDEFHPIPSSWFENYAAHAIDMTSTLRESAFWWDKEVLHFFRDYGVTLFSKLDIWDQDWVSLAKREGFRDAHMFEDPRSKLEELAHRALRRSRGPTRPILKRVADYGSSVPSDIRPTARRGLLYYCCLSILSWAPLQALGRLRRSFGL